MNIVFAGGGSGGHVYPAIVIADELREKYGASITFVGTADRLETAIVPQAGYRLETISARPFSRSLGFVFANIRGIFQSMRLLKNIQPDIVIATGGYVCFPFVIASRLRFQKTPIALLEPNVKPGLTNRVLTPLVTEVWTAYQPAPDVMSNGAHNVYTGVPLRNVIKTAASIPKRDARIRLRLDPNKNVLLVMGGSQGARSINNAAIDAMTKNLFPENWQILLLSSKSQTQVSTLPNLRIVDYLDNMGDAYAASDLVLARAGASTLAELRAVGLPAIIVPLPPHVAGNHQEANAKAFAMGGSALVLLDDELSAEALARAIEKASKLTVTRPQDDEGSPVERILARIEGLLSRKQA